LPAVTAALLALLTFHEDDDAAVSARAVALVPARLPSESRKAAAAAVAALRHVLRIFELLNGLHYLTKASAAALDPASSADGGRPPAEAVALFAAVFRALHQHAGRGEVWLGVAPTTRYGVEAWGRELLARCVAVAVASPHRGLLAMVARTEDAAATALGTSERLHGFPSAHGRMSAERTGRSAREQDVGSAPRFSVRDAAGRWSFTREGGMQGGTVEFPLDEVLAHGSGAVTFGKAPDGLCWIVQIEPPSPAAQDLHRFAGRLGVKPDFDLERSPLGPIAAELDSLARSLRRRRIAVAGRGEVEVLIVPVPLPMLTGPTLLGRLLPSCPALAQDAPAAGPPPLSGPRGGFGVPPPRHQTTSAPAPQTGMAQHAETARQLGPSLLKPGLPVDGSAPLLVRETSDENGWPTYGQARPFVEESLAAFPATVVGNRSFPPRFDADPRADDVAIEGVDTYVRQRASLPTAVSPSAFVPRKAIAHIIALVALELEAKHGKNEVHGDVKPANVLVGLRGVRLFDSLGLAAGERSHGLTPGWAAPEQLLARPVSPRTDQYPLGLMLLELLGGVLYGEETRLRVPTGKRDHAVHDVFRDPGGHIDPASGTLDKPSVNPWRTLIERCLRFEAAERLSSMLELASALESPIQEHPPKGGVELPLELGMPLLAAKGEVQMPVWRAG
jgi:hypothetical protein